MARAFFAQATLLALVVLTVQPAADSAATGPEPPLALDLQMDGWSDTVTLEPRDLRSPALRAADAHHTVDTYIGRLDTTGGTLHLIHRDGLSLGLVATPLDGLVWVHQVAGALVPFSPAAFGTMDLDFHGDELEAPTSGDAEPLDGGNDGVLQLQVERDHWLVRALGDDESYAHVMDVMFLVEAIYLHQFGIPFEIVAMPGWTSSDPYGTTTSGGTFLWRVRNHWEGVQATTRDDRELHHTFTGRGLVGINGIAYVGQLEASYAYGVTRHQNGVYGTGTWPDQLPHPGEALTAAHEIGHNFNGLHSLATPTPAGPLDPLTPGGCVLHKYGTILYPCGVMHRVATFSDTRVSPGLLGSLGVARDGGNAPRMESYSSGRI